MAKKKQSTKRDIRWIYKRRLKIIGANLRALRTAQGEQIEAVAKENEMSAKVLDRIERGEYHGMLLLHLLKLSRYYRVSASEQLEKKRGRYKILITRPSNRLDFLK